MLYKVTHCVGCVLANTSPHQLRWDDQKMRNATYLMQEVQLDGKLYPCSRWKHLKDSVLLMHMCMHVHMLVMF